MTGEPPNCAGLMLQRGADHRLRFASASRSVDGLLGGTPGFGAGVRTGDRRGDAAAAASSG